jgi:hypothetical protein
LKSDEFAEGLAAAGLSVLFFWGLRLLPLLGAAAIPAAALPLVRFACRRGFKPLLLPVILAAAASGAVAFSLVARGAAGAGPSPLTESLREVAVYVGMPVACAVAGAASRRTGPSGAFLGLSLYGAAVIAAIWLGWPDAGREIVSGYDSMAKARMTEARQGGADAETLRAWQAILDSGRVLASRYAPGLLSVFWILLAAPSFFLGRRLARMPESFSDLRLPPLLAMLFVASGATVVAFHTAVRQAAADVLAPLLVLYFLCGLSIITHFARRYLRLRVLRAALYLAVSVAPFSAVTAGLGLFDWYFDFRRRAVGEEKER